MNVRWKKLLVSVTFWLATESLFNFIGIDDIADYSEFILNQQVIALNWLKTTAWLKN